MVKFKHQITASERLTAHKEIGKMQNLWSKFGSFLLLSFKKVERSFYSNLTSNFSSFTEDVCLSVHDCLVYDFLPPFQTKTNYTPINWRHEKLIKYKPICQWFWRAKCFHWNIVPMYGNDLSMATFSVCSYLSFQAKEKWEKKRPISTSMFSGCMAILICLIYGTKTRLILPKKRFCLWVFGE